jgi:hypothetical protein
MLVEQRPLGFQVAGDEPLLLVELVQAGGEAGELFLGAPALLLDAPSPGPPVPEKHQRPGRREEKEQSSQQYASAVFGVALRRCGPAASYFVGARDETRCEVAV